MKKTIASLLLIMIIGLVFSPIALVSAQGGDEITVLENPLEIDSIEGLIQNIVDWIFKIALIIAPIIIVIAGIVIITAGGNPDRITKGKKIIIWTVIGFLIIVFSKGIINLIEYVIGRK